MNTTQKLQTKLVVLGASLNPPRKGNKITEVESSLGCLFPAGIKEFYSNCDGVDNATSQWIWDFFSLDRLTQRTKERRLHSNLRLAKEEKIPYNDLVCFCDVLIDAPTYLFYATPNKDKYGYFYADQGHEGWLVADCYEKFVDIFIAQNDDILLMGKHYE
jgi:SMI1 / KNR4 family (SUKH-1)